MIKNFLITDTTSFWKQAFGEDLYQKLVTDPQENFINVEEPFSKETEGFIKAFLSFRIENLPVEYEVLQKELFGPFYQYLIAAFLRWKKMDVRGELLRNPLKTTIRILFESVREIPVRVCMEDMHEWKNQGKLRGKNTKEEYRSYCENRLGQLAELKQLLGEYPELLHLMGMRLLMAYKNWTDFLYRVRTDQKELESSLCRGKSFRYIEMLEMNGSDSHKGGKKVIKLCTDNGVSIIYKPHGLKKEVIYQKLYGWFCEKLDLEKKAVILIDKGEYGWEECLVSKECEKEEQVQRYYIRMGIHLFLCMLFGTSDMHQENVLAVGEYPVILDLETFPGIRKEKSLKNADEKIGSFVEKSVLHTGILPVFVWKNENAAVNLGALSRYQRGSTSVRLPVLEKAGTSEMKFVYRYLPLKEGESMPALNQKRVDPGRFVQQLCAGFERSYRLFLEQESTVETFLCSLWECPTRFLIRHTQQYSMYLASSLHPRFLKRYEDRLLLLQILQKENADRTLVEQEISEMLLLDIPLFEWTSGEYCPYFKTSALNCYERRKRELGEEDLNRQLALIRLSLEMADPENLQDKYFSKKEEPFDARQSEGVITEKSIRTALLKLIKETENTAVHWEEDLAWPCLHMEKSRAWNMEAAGIDLYSGICGIAVFLTEMKVLGLLQKNDDILERLTKKLFSYTDAGETEGKSGTGLFCGEGSIAYTYLLLYRMTGKKIFWRYSQKQLEIIDKLSDAEKDVDLLSGNAGYIILLTEMYRESGNDNFLLRAIFLGDLLWEKAVRQETGYGWEHLNSSALSGMAHGNSGFIVAYASLFEFTKEEKYAGIIHELLLYENSLYSNVEGNWRDMRFPMQKVYSNAWCHGAAGILLARLRLYSMEAWQDPAVCQDIGNAARVLFDQSERRGLCLCHGMAGNVWIMRQYCKCFEVDGSRKTIINNMTSSIVENILKWETMLPQDRYMAGFMTGLSGVGCVLGEIYAEMTGQDLLRGPENNR